MISVLQTIDHLCHGRMHGNHITAATLKVLKLRTRYMSLKCCQNKQEPKEEWRRSQGVRDAETRRLETDKDTIYLVLDLQLFIVNCESND